MKKGTKKVDYMDKDDPLYYNVDKDKEKIIIPKEAMVPMIDPIHCSRNKENLIVKDIEVPSLIEEDGSFTRPRSRAPSYKEAELLGSLVGMGMPLEMACSLLTPPLKYEKVEKVLSSSYKLKTIYKRSQAKWLHSALTLLLTKPPKEIAGLIFILKNRHSKLFDATRFKFDLTSGGAPLSLTSPEVIERARLYAKSTNFIDAEIVSNNNVLPLTSSIVNEDVIGQNSYAPQGEPYDEAKALEYQLDKQHEKAVLDKERAKIYLDSLVEGESGLS